MAERNQKSKTGGLHSGKKISPEERIRAARNTLLDMREKLLAEGLGRSLPEGLARPFEIGDEGDRSDVEQTHEVSILLSARDQEKVLAIDGALEKIRGGTYGVCEECADEIGAGRLKAMPLAKLCIPCQSTLEKERAHQRSADGRPAQSLADTGDEEEAD